MISDLRRLGLVAGLLAATALMLPLAGQAQSPEELCADTPPGITCGPGGNRRTAGGGNTGNVPHNDGAGNIWPAISGILWIVQSEPGGQEKLGGPMNDELLGHHGSDHLSGAGGNDVLWGDWDPKNNSTSQRDYISGGSGNDWLYSSHGRSQILGGPGTDYVWGYYGKGTIDCGPGQDTARVRTNGAFRLRNCEKVRHFCSNGEDGKGNCLSPTGKPVPSSRRRR